LGNGTDPDATPEKGNGAILTCHDRSRSTHNGFAFIAGVALVFRAILWWQYLGSPFCRAPGGDEAHYWLWAEKIAAGAWKPDGVFYQGPLYPYILALIKTVWPSFGPASLAAVQLLINWITCLLLLRLFSRFVAERVALVATLFALFFSPAVFFALKGSNTTVGLFLLTLGLLALPTPGREPARRFLLAGLLTGLMALAVPAFILVLGAVAVFLSLPETGNRDRVGRMTHFLPPVAYVLGALFAIFPVTVSNYLQDGSLVLISSDGGGAFNQGNNPWTPGTYSALPGVATQAAFGAFTEKEAAQQEEGRTLNAQEVSGHFFRKGLDFIRENPLRWLVLMARKGALILSGLDVPHEFSLTRERRDFLPFLWAFPFGGTAILLLASLGLYDGEGRKGMRLSGLIALALGGICLVFYVGNRYVYPLCLFLMPAAGSGFFLIPSLLLRPMRAVVLIPVAVSAIWAGTVLANPFWEVDDYLPKLVLVYNEIGNDNLVVKTLERWEALAPGSPTLYQTMGHYYSGAGDWERALAAYDNALHVSPGEPETWYGRSLLLAKMGKDNEALAGFSRVLEMDPFFSQARIARIALLETQGRIGEVEEEWRTGLTLDPNSQSLRTAHSEWLVRRVAP
jgi:hypothetical protein